MELDDIIKEAMDKMNKIDGGTDKPVEQAPVEEKKTSLDDTASYLIKDEILQAENSKPVQAAAAAEEIPADDSDDVTISQDVFDSIIAKREKPAAKVTAGQQEAMDYISTGSGDTEEDLASLGIKGKEGKKVTDYSSQKFKKDSPKDFDKEYYEKYAKLKTPDFPEDEHHYSKKNRLKKNGKKRWTKKRKIITIILVILLILLLLVGAAAAIIHVYINKMNLVGDSAVSSLTQEEAKALEEEDQSGDPDSPDEDIEAIEAAIKANMEENAEPIISDDNVINILVIGTDSRDLSSDRGRSDSMILMSINKNTNQIIMTSFLRDIYCSIPGYGSTRLNHSYAYGGADLLMDTLEQNFKIKIDKYVSINFNSFVDVIDAVDGVNIYVTDDEVQYVNSYLAEINKLQGYSTTDSTLSEGGPYKLNGRQALAYSRIRYIGTDFGRTQRQRDVMEKVLEKAKDLSLTEMNDLLNVLLPEITTNLSEGEIFTLILGAAGYLNYDVVSQCIPQDSDFSYMTIRGMSVLGIDFDASIAYLKKTIYNS